MFEHHHTQTDQAAAIITKVGFALFLNTAFIVAIANTRVHFVDENFPFFSGTHRVNVGPEWYAKVGGSLSLTMLIDILAPHVTPISSLILKKLFAVVRLRCLRKIPIVIQKDLNELCSGPQIDLPPRLAYVMNTVSITIAYAMTIPVLVPFAICSIFVTYHVDRYL